jgi:phosphatidylglycerophosphatase A
MSEKIYFKKKSFVRLFLSLGGIGFLPVMPGTIASAGTLLFLVGLDMVLPLGYGFRGVILLFLIGGIVFLSRAVMQMLEKIRDYQWIVLDEVVGMMIAVSPLFFWNDTNFWWFVGFLLFRFFDIRKPLGISKIDQSHSPMSILMDDIIAGIYSALLLTTTLYVAG